MSRGNFPPPLTSCEQVPRSCSCSAEAHFAAVLLACETLLPSRQKCLGAHTVLLARLTAKRAAHSWLNPAPQLSWRAVLTSAPLYRGHWPVLGQRAALLPSLSAVAFEGHRLSHHAAQEQSESTHNIKAEAQTVREAGRSKQAIDNASDRKHF